MKTLLPLLAMLAAAVPSLSAPQDPAKWTLTATAQKAPPGSTVVVQMAAKLEEGWHLYSLTTPPGPIRTTLKLADNPAVESFEVLQPKPVRKYDEGFSGDTETYEGAPVFYVAVKLKPDAAAGPLEITAQVRYQVCTNKECLPPVKRSASATITVEPGAPVPAVSIPADYLKVTPTGAPPAAPAGVTDRPISSAGASQNQDLGAFLLVSLLAGLAAIFTPCVFPMIPITMSFFLARGEVTRAQSIKQAVTFCVGIIVLFTGLGLAITAVLGPFGVVQLGSNIWVNLFISAVFLAFGLSLLGAFEITLPSGLLTKMQQASEGGGIGGTLLMGVTFSLTSFACVGPFVGTLLAASVQGGKLQPALGMATFATGLSLPFFLLALFPSYLRRMPKSGGWLARVKIVLGFIVLAAMFKYVSNVDQVMQWNLLTRERFLAAWVVLFALPGLYLLGFLRMEGVKSDQTLGVWRTLIGAAFLIFAVSLLPGMFGSPLGELDAYVPFAKSASASPAGGAGESSAWIKNDYKAALDKAKTEGKMVLVSFTGYACTNCHWMKANMFPRPEIVAALKNIVVVELYTDGTDAASESNQKMQQERFGTVAIPFYALVDAEDKVLAKFPGVTRDTKEFVAFLTTSATTRAKL